MVNFKIYQKYAQKGVGNGEQLTVINKNGQYEDSGYVVDDAAPASTSVLYTSEKAATVVGNKADKIVPAANNNLAKIDLQGQYQDSGVKIDDAAPPSSSVLYTSNRAKVYLSVALSATSLPLVSGIPVPGIVNLDPFSIWSTDKAIIPRDGVYVITATLRVGPSAAASADRWIQLECYATSRWLTFDRFVTGSSIAGVGDNDSIFLRVNTVQKLTSGEQVRLSVTNALGLVKSVTPHLSVLTLEEI